ncbi:uncharacterized protein FYW61_019052 [Anableps anableps]
MEDGEPESSSSSVLSALIVCTPDYVSDDVDTLIQADALLSVRAAPAAPPSLSSSHAELLLLLLSAGTPDLSGERRVGPSRVGPSLLGPSLARTQSRVGPSLLGPRAGSDPEPARTQPSSDPACSDPEPGRTQPARTQPGRTQNRLGQRQEVSVRLRQDVTLPCRSGGAADVSVLKWSRPGLSADGYVYFYRNKRSFEGYQHPRFHGRVALRDAGMKGGDASLTLRNATFEDAGLYRCLLQLRGQVGGRRSSSEISRLINLTVTGAATSDGSTRLEDADGGGEEAGGSAYIVAAAGLAGLAGLVAAFLSFRLKRKAESGLLS